MLFEDKLLKLKKLFNFINMKRFLDIAQPLALAQCLLTIQDLTVIFIFF